MKKLITAKEVENAILNGDKVMYRGAKTLVTPAAFDLAKDAGITWCVADAVVNKSMCTPKVEEPTKIEKQAHAPRTNELVEKVMDALKEKGLLDLFLGALGLSKRFKTTSISDTLQVQHLSTIEFDSKNEEILLERPTDTTLNTGVCLFESPSTFTTESEMVLTVLCGDLSVSTKGQCVALRSEDVLHLPCGEAITITPSPKAKVFFVKNA